MNCGVNSMTLCCGRARLCFVRCARHVFNVLSVVGFFFSPKKTKPKNKTETKLKTTSFVFQYYS